MTKAHSHRLYILFIYALFASTVLSIVVYVSLAIATIFATSHRTAAVQQSGLLVSRIGELEHSFLTLSERVNQSQAATLGLSQPAHVSVVTVGTTVSLGN